MYNISADALNKLNSASFNDIQIKADLVSNPDITNMVTNGDFSADLTGWSTNSASYSRSNEEKVIGSHSIKIIGTAIFGRINKIINNINITGNKYYVSLFVKATANNDFSIRTAGGSSLHSAGINILSSDFMFRSILYTALGTENRIDINSGNGISYYDGLNIVNLTSTFGAGNEPSKEEMDEWFEKHGWFDGTTNFSKFIDSSNIIQNSFNIDKNSISGENIEIGNAETSEVTFILDNKDGRFTSYSFAGAKLNITQTVGLQTIPVGVFYVDSPPKNLSTIKITALDGMSKFNTPYETVLEDPTLLEVLEECCDNCGITLATTTFLNDSYACALPTSEVTHHEVVGWVAQLAGANAWINRAGELVLSWYGENQGASTIPITADQRFTYVLDEQDIALSGIIYRSYDLDYVYGTAGYALVVENNELLKSIDIDTIIPTLVTKISGYTYRPFEFDIMGYPHLDPMDEIIITDADGNFVNSIITNHNYSLNGKSKIKGKGQPIDLYKQNQGTGFTATQRREINKIASGADSTAVKDDIAKKLGYTDYADMVSKAIDGDTIISGGYINTELIEVNTIRVSQLLVGTFDNLVENGGFEAYEAGWFRVGGVDIDTSNPNSGECALLIQGTGGEITVYADSYVPVVHSEKYIMSFWYMASGANGTAYAPKVIFYDENYAYVSESPDVDISPVGVYTKIESIITVPTGVSHMQVIVRVSGSSNTGYWFFDDVLLRRAASGSLIVDGKIESIDGKTYFDLNASEISQTSTISGVSTKLLINSTDGLSFYKSDVYAGGLNVRSGSVGLETVGSDLSGGKRRMFLDRWSLFFDSSLPATPNTFVAGGWLTFGDVGLVSNVSGYEYNLSEGNSMVLTQNADTGNVIIMRDGQPTYQTRKWSVFGYANSFYGGLKVESGNIIGKGLVIEGGVSNLIAGYTGKSWVGSSTYPTIMSSIADGWVMFLNPHIVYTQNGQRGYTGTTYGANIRFEKDTSTGGYWDLGVLDDIFRIGRQGVNALTIDSSRRIKINGGRSAIKIQNGMQFHVNIDTANTYSNIDARTDGTGVTLHKYRNSPSGYLSYKENWFDGVGYHSVEMRSSGIHSDGYRLMHEIPSSMPWGSINVYGIKGGYGGFTFPDAGNNVFMVRTDGLSGVMKGNQVWAYYFDGNGRMEVGSIPWARVVEAPSFASSSHTHSAGTINISYHSAASGSLSGGGSINVSTGTNYCFFPNFYAATYHWLRVNFGNSSSSSYAGRCGIRNDSSTAYSYSVLYSRISA